jgi:hypothetical protein
MQVMLRSTSNNQRHFPVLLSGRLYSDSRIIATSVLYASSLPLIFPLFSVGFLPVHIESNNGLP